jgi:hypothetical protein
VLLHLRAAKARGSFSRRALKRTSGAKNKPFGVNMQQLAPCRPISVDARQDDLSLMLVACSSTRIPDG